MTEQPETWDVELLIGGQIQVSRVTVYPPIACAAAEVMRRG